MWEYVKHIAIWVSTISFLAKFGPPAVETYYLPTIDYVAGTFNAILPQPAPATTFMETHTPMPAGRASPVLKTDFVRQAGYETMSVPEATTMTGINNSQRPFIIYQNDSESWSEDFHKGGSSENNDRFDGFPPVFRYCSPTIYDAVNAILLNLRPLIDFFHFRVFSFAGHIVSWKLLKYRNKVNIKNLKALHELELVRIQRDTSALTMDKDLEISSLTAANKSQREQLDTQKTLLDEAKKEARLVGEAKMLAEEQSRKVIANLNASMTNKDDIIADRDENLAKATERTHNAENAKKTLEGNARKSRSDFESALQKRQNNVDEYKRKCEKATEDGDKARRELKDARVQAGKDKKKITELETQASDSSKKAADLDAQVKENDASIRRKDGTIVNMRGERQKLIKDVEDRTAERNRALRDGREARANNESVIAELRTQIVEANNLRKLAEAKSSEQEALATKAAEQREVAQERAMQQETRAAAAEKTCKAAEEKASQEQANAAEAADLLKTKEERIATLKADSETSYRYLQRRLDIAEAANVEMGRSLAQARADAQEAEAAAKESQQGLQERIAELEQQRQVMLEWSGPPAPESDSSSQESSTAQPRPIVRFPGSGTEQKGPSSSDGRPVPRWEPPANGKTKTPPEGRGLPANTPTGPKAYRQGRWK